MDVVTIGSNEEEILYKQAATVADIDERIVRLTQEMIDSLVVHKGIGLAGPQVNEQLRLFVTHAQGDIPRVFINPEIIMTSNDLVPYEEGCLSVPGIYADVMRPEEIQIQAWNEKGKPFTLDATGILARVIQHEYDHLRGKLFIDRLNEKKRERLLKQYARKNGQ
ncbi:MAG: peptide deformylase [Spirochaetales bacterium]|uniref:Peptide deformylase n=1 Tax=Candidatus Thalassospirochaeta sargassi TaxID=3119039 RepID=A0AAJ1IDM7_9SPIO|nr:peptide deformylase [Spirochaetales bacterium]